MLAYGCMYIRLIIVQEVKGMVLPIQGNLLYLLSLSLHCNRSTLSERKSKSLMDVKNVIIGKVK